jgi:ABC-2 type transport system ATP-binding protein
MIKVENLLYDYSKKSKVFNNLKLNLKTGGIIGLLGKNGAGKTTLLKLLSGMLHPKDGEIAIDGLKPGKRQPELLRKIFLIPEEIYSPHSSIGEFLYIYSAFYPEFDDSKFLDILKSFDLTTDQKFSELSYGQKKRIWLTFAVSTGCRFIFMDEPTNGLDIPSKTIFRQLITSELDENRLFIISSHQIRDIDTILDSLIILEEGIVKLHESIEDISTKYMIKTSEKEPGDESIYTEKLIDGYKYLQLNTDASESNMDLEFLFNAITNNKMKFETRDKIENEKLN